MEVEAISATTLERKNRVVTGVVSGVSYLQSGW